MKTNDEGDKYDHWMLVKKKKTFKKLVCNVPVWNRIPMWHQQNRK